MGGRKFIGLQRAVNTLKLSLPLYSSLMGHNAHGSERAIAVFARQLIRSSMAIRFSFTAFEVLKSVELLTRCGGGLNV